MKTDIMREFVRLTETKSYTKTSEEMYIVQSALSRHIFALEDELGCQLINRSRTTFELTPAGELVRKKFKKILAEHQDLLEQKLLGPAKVRNASWTSACFTTTMNAM